MSLLTTTSLIVVWCTLEVVNSQILVQQPPIGSQMYASPQGASSYPVNAGYQINNTYPASQDGEVDPTPKEGKNPYKMFYIEKDQFRCEECDENGNIRGNMSYVDGKLNAIRTVKYETKDIPLDSNVQETGASAAQPTLNGAQDAYQQQFVQGQQMQAIAQGQQLQAMAQPQLVYQGQLMQAQGQNYQGNPAGFGPPNNNYPIIQQQNTLNPQLPIQLVTPNVPTQNVPGASQANNPYASAASTSFPFALEKPLAESVSPGVFGIRPLDNRANNQGLTNAGGDPSSTLEALAAEAIRNLQPQPQPSQTSVPAVQPQPQVLNDNGFGSLAQRFNFINSNGDDKSQGSSILSSPAYQQPLFSTTSTGVIFNREPSGAYNFEYKTPDISRKEVADEKNNVVGSYAYRDPNGGVHDVQYNSGPQGFNAREQSAAGAQTQAVMPAVILVPTQQPGSLPFAVVTAGNSNGGSALEKSIPREDDSAKPSDTDVAGSMLQRLAKQIVLNMGSSEKSGSIDGSDSPQPTAEGGQPTGTR